MPLYYIPTLTLIVAVIGCVLTCIGWYVTHTQAKLRELRKETRAIVDSFNSVLDKLIEASHGYYGSTRKEHQEKSKLEIHAHISRLSGIIEQLEKLDSGLRLNQKFVPLYEAITGGDFESANVERGDRGAEKYKRIILLSDKVRDECEDWFRRYHKDN